MFLDATRNWLRFLESIRFRTKTAPVFVHNFAIRLNCDGNNIFLRFDGVLIFSLAVEELLKPGDLVINDLLLRFQLGFKNHVSILIADQRHWPLAECVDVNAEAVPKV